MSRGDAVMGDNTGWADLNKDGRRLEKIIKQMDTKLNKTTNTDLQFGYIDRLIKCTHEKVNIAEIVLNVKATLKEAKKQKIEAPFIHAK